MVVLRIVGTIFLALAFMFLGADTLQSLELGSIVLRSFADGLALLPGLDISAAAAEGDGIVGRSLSVVLGAPAWSILGVTGALLTILFRDRQPDY